MTDWRAATSVMHSAASRAAESAAHWVSVTAVSTAVTRVGWMASPQAASRAG